MNTFRLDNRLALITGSSAGIGEALARGLCEAGAHVVINGRRREAVASVVEALQSEGHTAHAAPFDVTEPAQVADAVGAIESDIGAIDILVNNAGIQRRETLEAFKEETWRELMSTNLDSVFYVAKAVVNHMIPRKHGSIINRDYGSSFRLASVLTDIPLLPTQPQSYGVDDFCSRCQVCSNACPPDAILPEKVMVRGERKWYVDFDKCIPFFNENAGCAICIAVCPWSIPGKGPRIVEQLQRRALRQQPADDNDSS